MSAFNYFLPFLQFCTSQQYMFNSEPQNIIKFYGAAQTYRMLKLVAQNNYNFLQVVKREAGKTYSNNHNK